MLGMKIVLGVRNQWRGPRGLHAICSIHSCAIFLDYNVDSVESDRSQVSLSKRKERIQPREIDCGENTLRLWLQQIDHSLSPQCSCSRARFQTLQHMASQYQYW